MSLFVGYTVLVICIFSSSLVRSRPAVGSSESSTVSPNGPVATVNFLRKYGYLEVGSSNSSETIYTEERIREGILLMQKFGGVAETGVLDNATVALLTKSRCGVPDVVRSSNEHTRTKRFVIPSKGWNKRSLSYSLQNWSPKLGKEAVMKDMSQAFKAWEQYGRLSFKEKPINSEADIQISFARGYHGDSYPFDGRGQVLAHAFFPNDYGGLAGDIHFDEDEDWWSTNGEQRDQLQNPISFASVAAHELGHSLGLGHSSDQESIMYPYYQGKLGAAPALGYDDILGMYQLYIQRDIPEDKNPSTDNEVTTPTSHPRTSTTTESPVTSTPRATTTTTTSKRTTTRRWPGTTTPTTTPRWSSEKDEEDSGTEEKAKPDYDAPIRNICSNLPLKISFLRNEIFVFRGQYMWRLAGRGVPPPPAYPVTISHLFSPLSHLKSVDAAYERDVDGQLIFFSGRQYWELDGTTASPGSPKPLTALGLPASLKKLDGAFTWEKNGLTYFFSGDQYWRYNETLKKIDDGYPLGMERWGGVPTPIDSVLRWRDGKTYFFKDGDFWRFDDISVHVEDNFPLKTKHYWLGC